MIVFVLHFIATFVFFFSIYTIKVYTRNSSSILLKFNFDNIQLKNNHQVIAIETEKQLNKKLINKF